MYPIFNRCEQLQQPEFYSDWRFCCSAPAQQEVDISADILDSISTCQLHNTALYNLKHSHASIIDLLCLTGVLT